MSEMTAEQVKQALRVRHAATQFMGSRKVPGGWTVVEEYRGIDVLAFSAHASPQPSVGVRHPRVGYEVKVSRSDYRRELLRPHKRRAAVEWCNAFYFAVPAGLLTADEIAFQEPDWTGEDFIREPCPEALGDSCVARCHQGKVGQPFIGPLPAGYSYRWSEDVACEACEGRGHAQLSLVEREAPTLWVPRDVGLVAVDGRGCRIVKRSPLRREVPGIASGGQLNELIRWVSARPDPRHHDVQVAKQLREVAA